jgi:ParB family transcriptional regulator, chromosome partitioning protein
MIKRKALGKGLSALIPEAHQLEDRDERFFLCPVDAIEPNPNQPRRDFGEMELDEMAQSVREKGVITPLVVTRTETGYQIIAGERRWRAAQKAGLDRVPVVVREATATESLELAIIENIHRKDLNPIEEALAYQRLLEEIGTTQETLSKRLGKDRSTIANLLRLLTLPPLIQKDVIDGRLSMGHARVIAGLKGGSEQMALRDLVIKKGLSVRQLEALAQRSGPRVRSRSKENERALYMRDLGEDLRRRLGTKVELKAQGKRGRIIIHYYSDEELERLLELLP